MCLICIETVGTLVQVSSGLVFVTSIEFPKPFGTVSIPKIHFLCVTQIEGKCPRSVSKSEGAMSGSTAFLAVDGMLMRSGPQRRCLSKCDPDVCQANPRKDTEVDESVLVTDFLETKWLACVSPSCCIVGTVWKHVKVEVPWAISCIDFRGSRCATNRR